MPKPHGCACVHCCALHTSTLVLLPPLSRTKNAESDRKLLGEAARVLSTGGKYMLFSAFGNDGLGHKDMADMLAHPGFGGDVQVPFFSSCCFRCVEFFRQHTWPDAAWNSHSHHRYITPYEVSQPTLCRFRAACYRHCRSEFWILLRWSTPTRRRATFTS